LRSIGALVALGLALGLDSLRAGMALGLADRNPRRHLATAALFGSSDALASALGYLVGGALSAAAATVARIAAPVLLAGFGVYAIVAVGRLNIEGRDPPRWAVWGVPLTLSMDNLIAGLALGTLRSPVALSVAVLGVMSGALALAGLSLGGLARRLPRRSADALAGVSLLGLAVMVALGR
jgi:putative Mn2+ efflux pump MntP